MKKETRQLLLIILTVAMTVTLCAFAAGCDIGQDSKTTTDDFVMTTPEETTTTVKEEETTSTTTTTTTTTTVVNPQTTTVSGKYINPLTGIPTNTPDLCEKRPMAIVIDNINNAYPYQTGLEQADVLYEALVAPGITRFLAVISDYGNFTEISNLRSGRDYHIDIAANHNAVLVCHGGAITKNYDFYALVAERLGSRWAFVDTLQESWFAHADKGETYKTIQDKGLRADLLYNTVINSTALKIALSSSSSHINKEGKVSLSGKIPASLNFIEYGAEKDMTGGKNASNVELTFTMTGAVSNKKVFFVYSETNKTYTRYQDVKYSTTNGQVLDFTNVLILGTSVTNLKSGVTSDPDVASVAVTGAGNGCYFYGGKCIEITWSKYNEDGALTLKDASGKVLTLACGKTYIAYTDSALLSTAFYN